MKVTPRHLRLASSLFAVYVLWATSYLAIKQAIAEVPPLLLSGLRGLVAGAVLLGLAELRREARPSWAEARGAGGVGILAVTFGSGLMAFGLRDASSGTAAVLFAAMPIFVCLILALAGARTSRLQWLGSALGLAGVAMLNLGAMSGPGRAGNLMILGSAAIVALAAVVAARGRMPASMLWASSLQLLAGGGAALLLGVALGERMAWPSARAWLALAYLSLVISVFGYVGYNYLTVHAGPALATSYAYVNPPVAVAVGALFLGEAVTGLGLLSIAIVLTGVALVIYSTTRLQRTQACVKTP